MSSDFKHLEWLYFYRFLAEMYLDDSMVLIIEWAEVNLIEWLFYSDTCSMV